MKGKLKLSTVKKVLWGLTVLIVIAVVGYFFSGQEMYQDLWLLAIVVLALLYAAVKLLFWRCPHCGRLLGKLRLDSDYCYYCEEKLDK